MSAPNSLIFQRRKFLLCVLLFISSFSVFAQEFYIQGNVKSSKGEPLVGVAVSSTRSGNVALTDLDGDFRIDIGEGDVLQISYIGFVSQHIRVRNGAPLMIILLDEDEYVGNLYEIGYGQRRKKDVTGAVSEVIPAAGNDGWTTSAQEMLLGKIPGVTVITDGGAPGTGAVMRIRGGASLFANSEPLVVVDGFPLDHYGISGLDNWLSMINPNDIESFTILRDAGSVAIYGGQGANGVIQITTKKGQKGQKPGVSYHGNMTISTVPSRSRINVLDGNTFRQQIRAMYDDSPKAQSLLGTANTNWQDEIYQTAFSTDHHVSVAGGLNFMPYRVAIGYTGQDGVLETSGFKRFTASVNLTPTLFDDHLKFNIQARYMRSTTNYADRQAIKAALYMDPTQPITTGSSYWQWGMAGAPVNPVSLLYDTSEQGDVHSFTGMFGMEYRFHFAPSLSAHANIGVDWGRGDRRFESVSPMYTNGANTAILDTYSNKTHLLMNAYLQWNFTRQRNRLNIMAGYEWQRTENYLDTSASKDYRYREEEIYNVDFMGRIHYTHRNKYLISLDMRLGPTPRDYWGYREPDNGGAAVGVGWKINEEVFLRNSDKVTNLKLRATYGIAGQRAANPLQVLPLSDKKDSQQSYPVGSNNYPLLSPDFQPGYRSSQSYTDYLKELNHPEYTHTLNGGIDFGFFKDRIRGSVDYYWAMGFDLLGPMYETRWDDRYSWSWYYYRYGNERRDHGGEWSRMGIDASLDLRPIDWAGFIWDLGLSYSCTWDDDVWFSSYYNEAVVGAVSIGEGGYAIGGEWNSNMFYLNDNYNNGKVEQQATPRMMFGLNSTFRYKQFDLSTQWRSHQFNYAYNEVEADQVTQGWWAIYSPEGYLTNRTQQNAWLNYEGSYLSHNFVHDASFVRCDYITLGYTLPEIRPLPAGSRVYTTVQNPFVITSYPGADPEIGYITDAATGHRSPGIDSGMGYPRPISIVIGITLNF